MSDPIERYLADLERALPRAPRLRARILVETRDHLLEAAEEAGPESAVHRFGPPHTVARRFAGPYRGFYARLAALATLLVLLAFPLLLYPIPENTLPPAPWPEDAKPDHLAWKQQAVVTLFLVAFAACSIGLAALRRNAAALIAATALAVACLGAAAILGAVLSFQWAAAVPDTPGWLPWLSLAVVLPIAVAAAILTRAALFSDAPGRT